MTNRYAVVAGTLAVAEQYAKAFDLNPLFWSFVGMEHPPTGRLYDKITLVRPHWSIDDPADFEKQIEFWRVMCRNKDQFKVI